MKQILLATTNEGKFRELESFLHDLPIQCLSLRDLDIQIEAPEEIESTIEGNAILKAKYYGKLTGYITIADDAGMFVDALDGWPGVKSARIAGTSAERISEVLQRLEVIQEDKERTASFGAVLALYDPKHEDLFVARGEIKGIILKEIKGESGFGYDPIFYVPSIGKTYAEMTLEEKNKVSHRSIAASSVRRYILNVYGGKHLVVPLGIVVQDGKILINKRNDTYNEDLHGKWEFPGGGMEIGETIEENVIREVREECGYEVKIVSALRKVWTVQVARPRSHHYGMSIYLVPFVCSIVGGEGKIQDEEVLDTAWVDPDQVLEYDLIGENKKMYQEIFSELTELITKHQL
jgi:XTP/dITP diphosphohydrolase